MTFERSEITCCLGHTLEGKSVIESDELLTSLNLTDQLPRSGIVPGITGILKTEGIPAKVNGPFLETHGAKVPLVDGSGVFCRVIHFPPVGDQLDEINVRHRTTSVDIGVVLAGEIQLTLDDGIKTILSVGDIVVQRGTMHVRSFLVPAPVRQVSNKRLIGMEKLEQRVLLYGFCSCSVRRNQSRTNWGGSEANRDAAYEIDTRDRLERFPIAIKMYM